MAVSTNLGLYLPTREDYISVKRDLSDNYEIIDESAGMLEKGIAIVVNGDTAPRAISSGDYLFIKNHSTLATGGYHATANIANGAAITSSNVSFDSAGLINAAYASLNSTFVPSMLDVQNKSYTSGSINDLPYGIYRIYNSVTQIPIAVAGYCSCYLRENGTKLQVYTSDTNRTFTRTKVSDTWSNWEELAINSKLMKKATNVSVTADSNAIASIPTSAISSDYTIVSAHTTRTDRIVDRIGDRDFYVYDGNHNKAASTTITLTVYYY